MTVAHNAGDGDEGSSFHEVRRSHAADDVFDQIAEAILRGELPAGEALPPERVLAERFAVSRIIARQAVHRLADFGLVRVRQGGATLVQDPAQSGDMRVVELYYRLGPFTQRDVRDNNERQILQGYALLRVAAERASKADRLAIAAIANDYADAGAPEDGIVDFERRFWTRIAEAGGNRIFIAETAFWFRLLAHQPHVHHEIFGAPTMRAFALRELARRLVDDDDAPGFYLQITTPILRHLSSMRPSLAPPKRSATKRKS